MINFQFRMIIGWDFCFRWWAKIENNNFDSTILTIIVIEIFLFVILFKIAIPIWIPKMFGWVSVSDFLSKLY